MEKRPLRIMIGVLILLMSQITAQAGEDWISKLRSTDPQERAAAAQIESINAEEGAGYSLGNDWSGSLPPFCHGSQVARRAL